jgi:tetratricopeptide (TPR) repeat protein
MPWEAWRMSERERLARYVIPAERLRLEVEEPAQPRLEVIRAIYEAFCRRELRYDIEPYNSDLGVQSIRQPDAILEESGKGTCLDLALLFAGECLGRGLLAVMIVVRGHALVAVASEYDLQSSMKPERNAFQKGIITDLETLQRLIEDQGFVPVECTGFVKSAINPEGVFAGIARNADGLLEFDDAIEVGRKQLETKSFGFALDVEYLHQNNHPSYDPKSEELNALQEIKTILVGRLEKPDDARVLAPPASRVKLFGRDADLERAQHALQAGQTVLVHGMGGIGKTALALEVAKRLHESKTFPDGVLWINEVGRADVTSICDAVARALGNDTIPKLAADDQQKLADIRQLLETKHLVLILDNVGLPKTAREFREHCLPAKMGLLLTSRHTDLGCQETIKLKTLERADAKQLFIDRAEQVVNDDTTNDICEVLEDHPLALVIAAGRIRGDSSDMSVEQLLARLRDIKGRLGTISEQDKEGKNDNVTVSIRVSFEDPTLTKNAKTTFSNLSACFAETTGLELLSMLGETTESEMQDRLAQLVRRSLVNRDGDRYSLHALLRDYGRGELGDGLSGVQDRLIDCLAEYAQKYKQVIPEHLDHLEAENENLFKGLEYTKNSERMFEILITISEFLNIRGYWDEQVKIGKIAIKLSKTKSLYAVELLIKNNTANILFNQGNLEESNLFYSEILKTSIRLENSFYSAIAFKGLGDIFSYRNNHDSAEKNYKKSLRIFKAIGKNQYIPGLLHQLGIISQKRENYDVARDFHSKSIEAFWEIGDELGVLSSLHELGIIAMSKNEYDISKNFHKKSLEISKKLRDKQGTSNSLQQLGNVAYYQRDYESAKDYYNQSIKISRELGYQYGTANSVGQLGFIAEAQGQTALACQYFRDALELFEKIRSPHTEIIRESLERLGCL